MNGGTKMTRRIRNEDLDRTRVLERRRASFTGFFSVPSFSWWQRVGDLQTVPNPRWQGKFKVRGVGGGSGDLFGKKERENEARSKDGFYSEQLLFPISFLHFSLVFLSLSKDFPEWFLPDALFYLLLSPPPGWNFSFRRVLKNFLDIIRKYCFFFFCKKDYKRLIVQFCKLFFKVVLSIFFSRNDVICCNGCSGRLKKIFSRQQMVEKFQLKKLNFWSRLPPLFFNLIRARRVVILFTSVNLKSIPELCWLSFNSSNVWLSSYRLLRAVEWWNVSCDR